MTGITIYEFDTLVSAARGLTCGEELGVVPERVFAWLERQCLRTSEQGDDAWLRLTQRRGYRAIQVTHFVGVIRGPDGFQIEVLPKIGRAIGQSLIHISEPTRPY